MERILKALKDRRAELMLARKENHIRLSELDKITMKIKEYVIDNKLKKPDNWATMSLIIMDLSAKVDEAYEDKEMRKRIIKKGLKKLLKEEKISNGDLEIALDILKEMY